MADELGRGGTAAWLNAQTVGYDGDILANRGLSVLLTALCVVAFIWGLGLPYPLFAGW